MEKLLLSMALFLLGWSQDDLKWEGALKNVKDFTKPDESEFGYKYLLGTIRRMREFPHASTISYKNLVNQASLYRGEFVKIMGIVARITPIKLASQQMIYRIYIVDPSGEEGFICDLLEKPSSIRSSEEEGILHADLIETKGIFYKIVSYEAKDGSIARLPLIIAKSAQKVDTRGKRRRFYSWGSLPVIVGISFIALFSIILLKRQLSLKGDKRWRKIGRV
jgi:hypothetical protein